MALRYLNPDTQVAVLETLVDPALLRGELEKVPALAALLPQLDELAEVFRAALDARLPETELVTALAAVNEELEALDAEHDRLVRLGDAVLRAYRLVADPNRARAAERLRSLLFPDGRLVVRRAYLEEAGAAQAADERLEDADRAMLASMGFDGASALDLHRQRVGVGRALLASVTERNRLRARLGAGSAPRLREASLRWRRLMRLIRELADVLDLDEGVRYRIHGIVDDAESQARIARSRRRGAPADPTPDARHPAPARPELGSSPAAPVSA